MRLLPAALLLAACASGVPETREPRTLPLTAEEARFEAGAHALTWAEEPSLRWVEGEGIGPRGDVVTEDGFWRFVYQAPGRPEQLVVTVSPGAAAEAIRHREDPPSGAAPDAEVGLVWIDSDDALAAIPSAPAAPTFAMLLLATEPLEWRIRPTGGEVRWRVNARTGEVIR